MGALNVLIVNATLASFTGTETYVKDLALELLRRGHKPVVYAPRLGQIAEELRRSSVQVVDNLNDVEIVPDVIHGNHNTELITALLQFPSTPGIFFCHSPRDWISTPPVHPRIVAYVAVDDFCRDRLTLEHGISEEQVEVHLHGANLERFKPREPLPDRPTRALVFSNNANRWTHLNTVREACDRKGIMVDVMGAGVNASEPNPEMHLQKYDLVFAKARCALEAMAVGSAVVLCDVFGSGPMVTTSEFEKLRRLNFGIRTLDQKLDADVLVNQIAQYDPHDAAQVSRMVRTSCNLEKVVDKAISLYQRVIEEFRERPAPDSAAEDRAVAGYLRWLTLAVHQRDNEYESLLANSPTLRLRNAVGRIPLVGKVLNRLGRAARGDGPQES
jgi:hypothetical protein